MLTTPVPVLIVGSMIMAGFTAIAIGFCVLKDIQRFTEHQRNKRLERSRSSA